MRGHFGNVGQMALRKNGERCLTRVLWRGLGKRTGYCGQVKTLRLRRACHSVEASSSGRRDSPEELLPRGRPRRLPTLAPFMGESTPEEWQLEPSDRTALVLYLEFSQACHTASAEQRPLAALTALSVADDSGGAGARLDEIRLVCVG